jgi:hypothetical protein
VLVTNQIPQDCVVRELPDTPVPYDSADLQHGEGITKLRFLIAPSHGGRRAVVIFHNCHATYLGVPNDEALSGHRLAAYGLQAYAFQEVFNSNWIAEMELRNRVHPRHIPSMFEGLCHYIISFHDETFECVARSFTWTREEVRSQ